MAGNKRNTTTERLCPDCQGAGAIDVDHPSGNPALETFHRCGKCAGDGWIRWAPSDALTILAAERRGLLLLRDANPAFRASAIRYYNRAKATAMRPVPLPPAPAIQTQRLAA